MSEPSLVGLTALDEAYRHQEVRPAAATSHVDSAWAERCWHLVNLGGGLVLGSGRAAWPHRGRRTAVAGLCTGEVQFARRASEDFASEDDPDQPTVGPIRIEAVTPLKEVRLILDDPGFGLSFDLTYEARFPPVDSGRNRIEKDGVVFTDYMNFFQSGVYGGTVVCDGVEQAVDGRLGFRDRGWGLRKHEGAARRGMHIFCACELPEEALYLLVYETASARRAMTVGWLMGESGLIDEVVEVDHELDFEDRLLGRGTLTARLAGGGERRLDFACEGRLWMETVGYSALPTRSQPGADRFDLTDPSLSAELNQGFFDNACRFESAGVAGYGFVETGLGVHARYNPEPDAPA